MKLTISIVTFNNEDVIRDALNSIEKSTLKQTANCAVVVVDNSSTDKTAAIVSREFPKVTLIRAENMGFSAGHNKAIRYVLENTGLEPEYHLIMNPDVFFDEDVLEKLVAFMDAEKDAGLVMPKILYPDHQVQYLCKLLPTPFDLFGRRF
ncbi:MAG TPA: glycosyltransferase, partial [Candidatus Kapabacteria bacterium]|nr:glycosyltransferase [Candidatus Kapabacteria bacterium]